jgi:2-haloacid dehalogenase
LLGHGFRSESEIEFQASTDLVKVFKPDPAAYQIGLNAFRLSKQQIAFVTFEGRDSAGMNAFGHPMYWANRLNSPFAEPGVSADRNHPDLSFLSDFTHSWKY